MVSVILNVISEEKEKLNDMDRTYDFSYEKKRKDKGKTTNSHFHDLSNNLYYMVWIDNENRY